MCSITQHKFCLFQVSARHIAFESILPTVTVVDLHTSSPAVTNIYVLCITDILC